MIDQVEFSLYNQNVKFASGIVETFKGKMSIYSNR